MTGNTYKNLFSGVAWTAAMRWVVRAIGFLNILILARLLTPEAFGIVVMATIVMGFITSLTDMGVQQLLIREREINRDMINTAWTIRLMLGFLYAATILTLSPLATDYFDEPRLPPVIMLLSLCCVIDGFYNIGITLARKELQFDIDFKANVYARLITFVITLGLVLWLRNYWALVYGRLVGSMVEVIVSYSVHSYRPRVCTAYFGKFLRYSYAIVPFRISSFLNEKISSIVVGGVSGAATLGIFNIASDLAGIFTQEISEPLGRGLMPGFAKISDDAQALGRAFVNVFAVSSAVILPVGFGMCLVAEYVVPVLLGEQWLEAIVYVKLLAVYATLLSVQRTMSVQVLIVVGHEFRMAMLSWIRLGLTAVAAITAAHLGGALAVAQALPAVGLVMLPITMLVLVNSLQVTIADLLVSLWRPLAAVGVMAYAVIWINGQLAYIDIVMLVLLVLVGALAYMLTMLVTWLVSGRPDGIEYALLKVANGFAAR